MTNLQVTELERIEKEIEAQEERVRLANIRFYHKDRHGMGEWNELDRLQTERALILTGVEWDHFGSGTVLIKGRFIYSLKTGKWRVQGKSTWYRSKGLKHFVDNYANKGDTAR